MAVTAYEKNVTSRFLQRFNQYHGTAYVISDWPDEANRTGKAIDAIARHEGRAVGIEHTLLQPFVGEREDAYRFEQAIAHLEKKPELIVPDHVVDICVSTGAIRKGVKWSDVGKAVYSWYRRIKTELPNGKSSHVVPDLPFPLTVDVDKTWSLGQSHLFVMRWMPPETVEPVVRQTLDAKLAKLVAAAVDQRVLLLEKNSLPRSYDEIARAIESVKADFPLLQKVDEIWVINTVALMSEGNAPSYLLWPLESAEQYDGWRRAVTDA